MMGDIVGDSLDEFINGAKNSVAKAAFGNVTKEALDHIEPRGAGRREVDVETLVAFHPGFDLGMLMRGVVIANDVNLFLRRRTALDQVQEPDPFLVTVPRHASFQDRSVERVERREQRGGAVAFVVVSHRPRTPFLHR